MPEQIDYSDTLVRLYKFLRDRLDSMESDNPGIAQQAGFATGVHDASLINDAFKALDAKLPNREAQ